MGEARARSLLERGVAALRNGRVDAARRHLQKFVALAPGHPDGHHLLATALGQLGRLDSAERHARMALQNAAPRAAYFDTLGNILKQRGDRDAAADAYRRAIELDAGLFSAHYNLGLLLLQLDDQDGAAQAFRDTLVARPDFAAAHNQLGVHAQSRGEAQIAIDHFEAAIRSAPRMHQAHSNLGAAYVYRGATERALDCFEKALQIAPEYAPAWYNRGLAERAAGQLLAARASFSRANELVPNNPDTLAEYAAVCQGLGDLATAEDNFRAALQIDNRHAVAAAGLAELCEWRGDAPAGATLLESFDDADPRIALVKARSDRRRGAFAAGVERLRPFTEPGQRPQPAAALRRQIDYTLGDLYDGLGQYDAAFAHYEAANLSRQSTFDAAAYRRQVDALIRFFSPANVAALGAAGDATSGPLFIVGMPRSGTSLLEQMLSMHSQVTTLGERPDVGRWPAQLAQGREGFSYPDGLAALTAQDFESLAADYRGRHPVATGSRWICDKMPLNFFHLGLIRQVFPAARVLHCVRQPMDIALSCLRQDFVDPALDFSLDPADIGEYFVGYRRLMRHYAEVLDLPLHDVHYEALVADAKDTLRKALDFLDLDFEPACLEFHASKRFVATASHAQVRQRIYSTSVAQYKNYERHLAPFAQALQSGLRRQEQQDTP